MSVAHRIEHADCFDFLRSVPNRTVDLIVTSPPYFVGKSYDTSKDHSDFKKLLVAIIPELKRVLRRGGSICWQVGYHVEDGSVLPLDWLVHDVMSRHSRFSLRNRIVWTFGHGEHCRLRFSGRHETILWYSLDHRPHFDLDAVRVAQKYPGKRHYRGPNKGEYSGNPLGKNPGDVWSVEIGDVWEIPNVKANHIEKTEHPCQFPVALAARLVRGLSPLEGVVLDPFMGAGSTGVAAALEGRRFLGCDNNAEYASIAADRVRRSQDGTIPVRPDKPVYIPDDRTEVARRPEHFVSHEIAHVRTKVA